MAKNNNELKITSPRLWEMVRYILEESLILEDEKDTIIKIPIKKEDLIYMLLFSLFYAIEQDVYTSLEKGIDKETREFKLEATKATDRLARLLEIAKQIGVNERIFTHIAKIRQEIEFAELRTVNDIIRSIVDDPIPTTLAP